MCWLRREKQPCCLHWISFEEDIYIPWNCQWLYSPAKALFSLRSAMAAPMDNLHLYFQKTLKKWSRKGWSNNSGSRACSRICKQGRWSLLMGRRTHCQDALMTQTLGWQRWGNTRNYVLNAGAGLCWQPATLTWFKRAHVRSLCVSLQAFWSHKTKWRTHSALNEFWEV